MTIPKCTMCGNLHTGECPQRPGAVFTEFPPAFVACAGCGSRIDRDGKHGCPAVTRAEFDALRADLAIVARHAMKASDIGSILDMIGGGDVELKRIAEGK